MKEVCLYETCLFLFLDGVVAPPLSSCAIGMPWELMVWQWIFWETPCYTGQAERNNVVRLLPERNKLTSEKLQTQHIVPTTGMQKIPLFPKKIQTKALCK
jgi:hypothetical protein